MSSSVKFIFGEGETVGPKVIFIGEAPGEEEDKQGRPFVGRSGKLLDKMIEFMGLTREQVYITNIVKVRPDDNRTPTDEEIQSWRPLLISELEHLSAQNIPIVTLGACATRAFLGADTKITQVRGSVNRVSLAGLIYNVIPTFHPSYLLRNPSAKEVVKQDLLKAKELSNGFED